MITKNKNPEMDYEFPEKIEEELVDFSTVYKYGEKRTIRERHKDGTWTGKQKRIQLASFALAAFLNILSFALVISNPNYKIFNGIVCFLTVFISCNIFHKGVDFLKSLKKIESQKRDQALLEEPRTLWDMNLPHQEYEATKYKLLMIIFETRSLYKMVSDADSEDFGFKSLDERLGFLATRVISMKSVKDNSSLAVLSEIFIHRKNAKQLFKIFLPIIEMNFLLLEETLKKK